MKAKPVLLVIITLLIGFVLGWLTSAQVRIQKLKPVRLYYSEDRFRDGFFDIIQPDEKQKAEIEKILDKYAKINIDLQTDFRREFDDNMKSFRKDIDSILTREQLARFKDMDDRRQDMIRHDRRNKNDTTHTRHYDQDNRRDYRGEPFRRDARGGPQAPPPDSIGSSGNE